MSVILWYLHSHIGILYHVRVLSAEQISTTFKMSAQSRTSIPHKLGPLPSECYNTKFVRTHHREFIPHRLEPLLSKCYSMAYTYECRHTLHTRVSSTEQISTANKISVLSSMRTHHRASIPIRLGPLLSDCYSTLSITECGYSP